MGVKHPLGTVKYYKDTKRGGGVKKALKKAGRKEEETEKQGRIKLFFPQEQDFS